MISKKIDITVGNRKNEYRNITKLITKVVWSGDYKQAARTLEFTVAATALDTNIPTADIKEGYLIQFFEDNIELFRGWVYSIQKNSASNNIVYTAFDFGTKLVDVKDNYKFKNTKAEDIAKYVLTQYGFNIGSIVPTGVKYTKIFMGNSLYDIIMSAYTHASASNGKKYMITSKKDKIYIEEKGKVTLKLSFEEGKNIISNTYTSNIKNMVNKVIITDENGNTQSVVENKEDRNLYGLFQQVLQIQEGKDSNLEAKKMLNGIEQEASLTGFGDSTCVTGTAVTVQDKYTGLTGLFYIDADRHTWEDFTHTVDLNLAFKNMMNEVEAGQDEQKETSSSSSSGSYTSSGTAILNGKEVKALFTAYYPENSALQGGFYDAQGNKLDPRKRTCAAPKSVPFGTKIQIQGTGTNKDGQTYTVTDRGGAIKVRNGVYQFDLLMSNRKEAYGWGRKNGKAVIGDGTGYKQISSNSSLDPGNASMKAKDACSWAEMQQGKKYVWGTTGPNQFDCSGLMMWAYKKVGINIPRTSKEQSRYGKSISKSQLQLGDLIFFSTNGTGQVSHVGMYVGNGQMIHAANPKKGVRYDRIDSGYYAKSGIYKGARRVA